MNAKLPAILRPALAREVGLYFSSRTRDWLWREQAAEYFQSLQDAHKTLVTHRYGLASDSHSEGLSIPLDRHGVLPPGWQATVGHRRLAIACSVVASCRFCAIDSFAYCRDARNRSAALE
jgi:hypothetical protein